VKHLKLYKLDEDAYYKLMRLIKVLRASCESSDKFLSKFAEKCYAQEKDRNLANVQAEKFITAVFGSVDTVVKDGAEVALEILLRQKYHKSKGDKKRKQTKVEDIKSTSPKFSALLHEPDDEDIEKHPMWTRILNQYLIGPTLGLGGTSKVKLAYDTKTKTKVALKILKPKYAHSADKEINILKKLSHKNIVKVYDCFWDVQWDWGKTTIFAVEYCSQGELIEYLMYTKKFEDDLARWFFISLTEGIEYCHKEKVVHRDLKHDNCLLGANFELKITDFGFATNYNDEMMRTAIGTAQYAAPEILKGKKYTEAVDIFSMGVMLFIAIAGSQPWRRADPKKDRWYKMVHAGDWESFFKYHQRSHNFTEDQKVILKGLLEPQPKKRWQIKDIKNCKWYNNGEKLCQNDVAMRLQKRKREVDLKKFEAMKPGAKVTRKAFDIFTKNKIPHIYFQPIPRLSFVTDKKPEWVLEDIANVIHQMKGRITCEAKEKYKFTFHVTKPVDTGRYIDKNTRQKEYEKVRVCASVQMWTYPGQSQALQLRERILKEQAERKDSMSKKIIEEEGMNLQDIKSIAVFRAEGGGETKYLFPAIYSDILQALPASLIARDVFDEDTKEDL